MSTQQAPKTGEYLDGRLWFHRKGTLLTLGLTDHAIDQIGTVQSIDFPDEGETYDIGEVVITVEGTHGSVDGVAPASGRVQEVNLAAKEEPDMVSEDPLEEGWLVKLEIEDPTELLELSGLNEEEE